MAVVYFTSNASTGAGSLAEAIENASPGDVVRPDETVFERGSTIEIVLASPLRFTKDLTLDASPFRVRLDGGGSRRCVVCSENSTADSVVEFTAFDFVRGNTDLSGGGIFSGGTLTLNRCGVYGCSGAYGGGIYCRYFLTLNDCVVTGCRATSASGGIYAPGGMALNGATLMSNVSPRGSDVSFGEGGINASNSIIGGVYSSSPGSANYVGSVVDVASSAVGFVASPPDDLTVENWDADAWQNWDLRLLDDASDAPSPYRDSGDVDKMSRYDLQGNFRGRETNGASTCSPGAYETIQADLFWIGRDATGAEVVAPSFLTPDGWAASRFAAVSDDTAPQAGQNVFVDGDVIFVEFLSKVSNLTVGGGAVFASRGDQINFYASKLQVGLGATFKSKFTLTRASRVGAWARLAAFGAASATVDFDVASQADYFRVSAGELSTVPLYGRLELRPTGALSIKIAGRYDCSSLTVSRYGDVADLRIKAESATFRAKTAAFTRNSESPSDLFDAPVVVELYDAAEVTVPDGAPESWADAFEVDATDATSATLTLNGQTICGDAPTADVSLTGSAKVAERGLDVASLTLNAGSTLNVDGASVNVADLTVADGATVAFSPAASPDATGGVNVIDETNATDKTTGTNATDGTASTYVDAVLSATTSATVGAATFSGTGYFATPQGTDVTAATFAETVRACDYGASLTSFLAAPGVSGVALAWTVANADASVLLERQDGNGWAVVEARAVGGSARVDGLEPGTTLFRAFDGAQFLTAQTLVQASHIRLDYDDSSVVALAPVYEVVLEIVLMSDYRNRGESPLLLARVADSATGDFVPKDAVASIVYSARRVETLYGSKSYVDVEGHVDREIPLDAYFDLPVADDPRWLASHPNDERGYNFRFEPDSTQFPVLPEPGDYEIVVEIRFRQGNPAPLVFRTRVV